MKYLNSFFIILMICMLFGCGSKDNINENTKKEIKDDEAIKEGAMKIMLEPVTCDTRQIKKENNFSISVDSKEGKILLWHKCEYCNIRPGTKAECYDTVTMAAMTFSTAFSSVSLNLSTIIFPTNITFYG